MTRAFLDLGHGRFLEALQHNLASPLVYAATCALLLLALIQAIRNQEMITTAWKKVQIVALPLLISVAMVGWVLRLRQMYLQRSSQAGTASAAPLGGPEAINAMGPVRK